MEPRTSKLEPRPFLNPLLCFEQNCHYNSLPGFFPKQNISAQVAEDLLRDRHPQTDMDAVNTQEGPKRVFFVDAYRTGNSAIDLEGEIRLPGDRVLPGFNLQFSAWRQQHLAKFDQMFERAEELY